MKPQFITVEGVEGVGKSTNVTFIHQYLLDKGIDVVVTREPGGTPLAEDIRAQLLADRKETVCDVTELLLMFAARAQHIDAVIKPALNKGQWVLCDRFTDATFAYQGGGRGMDVGTIHQLSRIVQDTLTPSLTFLLDCDVTVGMERVMRRGQLDRFELEKIDFFERVRAAYLSLAIEHKARFRTIAAGEPINEVQQAIRHELDDLMECILANNG
ncbi:dTMP kinase [bacterium]|nr:dTMP kinase [bacterium]